MPVIEVFQSPSSPRRAWGSGLGVFDLQPLINACYFSGILPAFFERTLCFTELHLGEGALDWVLTGSRAGIMVSLGSGQVRVRQYFYDSYGLQFDAPYATDVEETDLHRAPYRIVADAAVPMDSVPAELSLVMDSSLGLSVRLDGRQVLFQRCFFEVNQHQVRFTRDCRASGQLLAPDSRSVSLQFQPDSRGQTILGFGGITSIPAYRMLSGEGRERWWQLLRDYNLLIQREYPMGTALQPDLSNCDDIEDALPHSYGDNFPNGEIVDFEYNRHIVAMGGTTWFEFWYLPSWMKAAQPGGSFCDEPGLDIPAFCRAIIDYCRRSVAETGVPPSVVGLQNERCQSVVTLSELVPALRRALDEAGFSSVRLHMSNAGTLARGGDFLDRFMARPDVWRLIDYAATNHYDIQNSFFDGMDDYASRLADFRVRSGERPSLATELCLNHKRYQIDSYRLAFSMAQLYHHILTRMQAEAICYCWLLLHTPQSSYNWTRTLCTVDLSQGAVPVAGSHQLRAFGAFSRKLPAGFQRIDCTSSDSALLASAWLSPSGNLTAILLNRGTSPLRVAFGWSGETLQAELCSPFASNAPASHKITRDTTSSWAASLDPGEIVTLYSEC